MKRISIGLAATLATVAAASGQTYLDSKGTIVQGVAPLVNCSSGGNCAGPVSATNPLPVTGSLSATLSGFQPGAAYATPLAVSTSSSRVALPSGTTVIVYNTGATAAYVQLGGSNVAATTANDVIPAGGWSAFSVGSNAYLAALTSSGTTTLNVSGGSGLPTGGGGGTVAQGSAASASGAWPVLETIGGAAVSAANGLFVNPATGATFPISGSVSLSGTPNVAVTSEVGAGSTGASVPSTAQFAGMNVGGNLTGLTGSANGLKVDGSAVTQPVSLSSLPALAAGANAIGAVTQASGPWTVNHTQLNGAALGSPTTWGSAPTGAAVAGVNANVLALPGSIGLDYSAGRPALPNIGANFAASGPYASYYLTATIGAAARNNVDIENVSGSQIAVMRDDGTAAAGAAPANASVFALGPGSGVGSQGGSYTSPTFKGRLQVYSPITTAITFTGALTSATSGTLTANWGGPTGSFYVTFSTGAPQLAAFTNGSTAVTWSTAVTATAAANAATAQVAAFVD